MLRRIRIGIALLVIGLFVFMFLDGENSSTILSKALLFVQFMPSLVKWILTAGGVMSIGFLFILLLTLVFGRVYCTCLCPLGILQDIVIFFSRKIGKKKTYRYQQPQPFIRYGIFVLTVVCSILGTLAFLNLLDPYSLFSRIIVQIFKPIGVLLKNLLVSILERFEVYTLLTIPFPPILLLTFIATLLFFLILLGMTIWRGRMYCNTLCPVGTLLGMVSRLAFYKISLDAERCIACGLCEKGCRAGCINIPDKSIDSTRCVACFDCLDLCPKSAVAYTRVMPKAKSDNIDPSKRRLLALSASAVGSLMLVSLPLRLMIKPILLKGESVPIVPPGALSVDHFTETCTACYLCVNICPARAIQPALFEYGLRGIMQPTMNYTQGYCVYECNACGKICPTGAITQLELEVKKRTQIGRVQLIKDRCIVHTKKQDCGACVEVCPTQAVYTVERENVLFPETKVEHCIGCGRCEYVCPVTPNKAILVEGNAVHAKAKEPFLGQQPARKALPQEGKDGFPF
jgi:ferredoxin